MNVANHERNGSRSSMKRLVCVLMVLAFNRATEAALILGPTQISPTTSIPFNGGFGSLAQIADGIDLNTDGPPYNGYAPNATSGIVTLTLDQPYDLFSFMLANDIYVRAESVKDFRLLFYDPADGLIATSSTLTAQTGMVPSQEFSFSTVQNVKRVDFDILNVYAGDPTRIEVREVAFTGTPTALPEPSTYAMALAGLACGGYSMLRRRKRA
jgi:hypothetical protein